MCQHRLVTGHLHVIWSIGDGPVNHQGLHWRFLLMLHEPHNAVDQHRRDHQQRQATSGLPRMPFGLGVVEGVEPVVDLLLRRVVGGSLVQKQEISIGNHG